VPFGSKKNYDKRSIHKLFCVRGAFVVAHVLGYVSLMLISKKVHESLKEVFLRAFSFFPKKSHTSEFQLLHEGASLVEHDLHMNTLLLHDHGS